MLERYFLRPQTVDRIRASWIGAVIEQYVVWLTDQQYARVNIGRRVPLLVRFGEFARRRGAKRVSALPQHVDSFVATHVREHRDGLRSADALHRIGLEARTPVEQMLRIAVPGFVGRGRGSASDPFSTKAPDFFRYLRNERGLRETTIGHYQHYLRALDSYLDRIGVRRLRQLSPPILSAFITERSKGLGKTGVRDLCGVLRVFLRYIHREQHIARDLIGSVESPRCYRLSSIPRAVTWEEVRRVLETVERRSPTGRRDYAILTLLITYGLRAREVAALTLDDIDWKQERLRVPERKAGHSTAYPLSSVVGNALLHYIRDGRPQTTDRRVFARALAPHKPLTYSAVSCLATRYLKKAGIAVSRAGSHTFRHTCAQRLVDADFSMKSIGDYLGHRSPDSTRIYTKVAIEALREVALGDGEKIL